MPSDKTRLESKDGVSVVEHTDEGYELYKEVLGLRLERERTRQIERLKESIAEAEKELAVRKKGLAKWQKDGLMRKVSVYQRNVDAKEQEIRELKQQMKELSDGND